MYCPKCGVKVSDDANFCSKCGTRIHGENSGKQAAQPNNAYSMYEVFDSTDAVSSKINSFFDRLLSTEDANTTLNRFTLTDRSIITDFGEIPYDKVTVLAPTGINNKAFGDGVSAGAVYTTIDGVRYQLYYTTQDALRFYLAAIRANTKIKKTSKRQLMQCMCMYYAYLLNARSLIQKLPVRFEGSKIETDTEFEKFFGMHFSGSGASSFFSDEPTPATEAKPFSEFHVCNSRVIANDDVVLSPENQHLVDTYGKIQEEFNQFLKENNPIPDSGQNRSPYTLGPLIELMEDSDPDASAAIVKYNEKIRLEKEMEERAAARRAAERRASGGYSQDSYSGSSRYERRRMEKEEIERERRKQEALKRNYYNTPKCQRYGFGKNTCAGCPIAHMCKH